MEVSALKILILFLNWKTFIGSLTLIFPHILTFPLVTQTMNLPLIALLIYNILEVTWSGTETGCESVIYILMGKTDSVLLQHFFSKTTVFLLQKLHLRHASLSYLVNSPNSVHIYCFPF